MGRSQLQYRARGRGGRDGQRGGRGGRSERHGETKPLESNAFRFTENEGDEEDINDEDDNADGSVEAPKRNLRFNPDIQHQTLSTGGAGHFQTKTMREWEDGNQKDPHAVALGLHEIGRQLQTIAPDTRFFIDPKYCIDLPVKAEESAKPTSTSSPPPSSSTPPLQPSISVPTPTPSSVAPTSSSASHVLASPAPAVQALPPVVAHVVPNPARSSAVSQPAPQPIPRPAPVAASCEIDDELDELLNM